MYAKKLAEGKDVPILKDAPELIPGLEAHYGIFKLLSHSRTQGFRGGNPIQVSDIRALLDELEISDPDLRLEIIEVILHTDLMTRLKVREKNASSPSSNRRVEGGDRRGASFGSSPEGQNVGP